MKNRNNFWKDKVVLITGGSSGIGLATAQNLAQKGARLWLMARDAQKLKEAQSQLFEQCHPFCGTLEADVSDPIQVSQAVEQMAADTGVPDVVIHCAGIVEPGYVQELSLDVFEQTMDVNFLGGVSVTKAILPGMMQRKSGQIVFISSAAGYIGVAGYTAYSASKYALRGFAEALRAEMRYHGINISIVFPPDTDTPQLAYDRSFTIPEVDLLRQLDGMATPVAVAASIVKGIEQQKFLIVPLTSNRFFYHLLRHLDTGAFLIMDWLSDLGRKKAQKSKG